jgi:hypothetical protein
MTGQHSPVTAGDRTQIRTVPLRFRLSRSAETSQVPSGATATAVTKSV